MLLPPRDWLVVYEAAQRGPTWGFDLNAINQLILGARAGMPGIGTFEVRAPTAFSALVFSRGFPCSLVQSGPWAICCADACGQLRGVESARWVDGRTAKRLRVARPRDVRRWRRGTVRSWP